MAIDRAVGMGLAGLLVLAVAGACVGAPRASETADSRPPNSSPTPAPSMISPEAAIKAVQTFMNQPVELTASGPEAMGIGMLYRLEGAGASAGISARVDAYSGRVVMLSLLAKMPGVARVLSDDQAAAAALRYLTGHGISVEGMRSTVEWMDHGASANYRVTWQLYQGEIKMPEQTEVDLDGATGQVFSFIDYRSPHGRAPDPKISREQAEAAAIATPCASNPVVKSAELLFTHPMSPSGLDPKAPLVLVWQIAVDTKTPNVDQGCIVWVDAMTGAAKVIAQH